MNISEVVGVYFKGDIQIYYAGFTEDKCLTLSSNGLVVPMQGASCDQPLKSICEYQSCLTKDGDECVFPFTYKDKTYFKCTSEDVYLPWCATKMNGTRIERWGLCLADCEHEVPEPSCLAPPPVPEFGLRDGNIILFSNYHSNWFNISFIDNSVR